MPGLFGFHDNTEVKNERLIHDIERILKYSENNYLDEVFIHNEVCIGRVANGILNKEPMPYKHRDLLIWLDGEIYNYDEMLEQLNIHNIRSAEAIIGEIIYLRKNNLFAKVDGVFSAVIYDSKNKEILLVSDRNGLKNLYYLVHNEKFYWFSEVKVAKVLKKFKIQIDKNSVNVFFEKYNRGHLNGDKTWVERIKLLEEAMVVKWSIKQKRITFTEKYWSYDNISIYKEDTINRIEAIEELSRLFKKAVKKRHSNKESIGLFISGGLDSRAIFAAIPHSFRNKINLISLGEKGSAELKIARMVSALRDSEYKEHLIYSGNWLEKRLLGLWKVDGHVSLSHFHLQLSSIVKEEKPFDINLSGFLGDAIVGGSYIQSEERGDFFKNIRNRGRRRINEAMNAVSHSVLHRYPFLDNDLMNFILALPQEWIKGSKLYNEMLLNTFPEYFMFIPWEKTGYPISQENHFDFNFDKKMVEFYSFGAPNYGTLLREDKEKKLVEYILFENKNRIYNNFINEKYVKYEWEMHVKKEKNYSINILKYVSFEIWLQQLFESNYISLG
ncbi:asparagine synthase-related protein [Robertmurraya sp. DFI.2.37]|uniref:asparagine synthase-related protein n=1 Tax=Robertmurraya sp. DFI.2.37 TaxID=3031819 RepID=UPI001245229C|nr:asparagine synthase-related protein [Robertmurraya sp. DFI.2.37]MDF1507835.1 asparagine synthase-related protein [Robertmurraya sp. DFI.2.37]